MKAPSAYKIITKKFDSGMQQYIFIIEIDNKIRFARTADELSKDKSILLKLDIVDIYDIAYTHGSESVLKEKAALSLAKEASTSKLAMGLEPATC